MGSKPGACAGCGRPSYTAFCDRCAPPDPARASGRDGPNVLSGDGAGRPLRRGLQPGAYAAGRLDHRELRTPYRGR